MENPNHKGRATKEDLQAYARYRAQREAQDNLKLLTWKQNNENKDMEDNEDYRAPLAINTVIELNITLSTGGDADGYKITLDKDGEVLYGMYYWADWGYYEEVKLSEDELNAVVDLYMYGDPAMFIPAKS